MHNKLDVSIVIVCMNNLKNLYPCLESIKKYTTVSYETLVVAYLFSKENLEKVKKDFPWVTFIESNEIRGFSENNNLALRQAKGKYCFVLNDDTYHSSHVIDNLVKTIDDLPDDVAIVSPVTLNKNGTVQRCGKPKYTIFSYILGLMGVIKQYDSLSKYTNQTGVFLTYNISGAAFLIKTEIFKMVGWFDEKYFFCPEDIALSTKLNNIGYKCFVDSNVKLTHVGGGTWSKTIKATKPAGVKGLCYFYGEDGYIYKIVYIFLATFEYSLKALYWCAKSLGGLTEKKKTMITANLHAVYALYSRKTPKELFVRFFKKK